MAHEAANALCVPFGQAHRVSLGEAQQAATSHMLAEWQRLYTLEKYRGHSFLALTARGSALIPSHLREGPWMGAIKQAKSSNAETACFMQAVLNHAPIGSYRQQFHPGEHINCMCNQDLEDQTHIIYFCDHYRRFSNPGRCLEVSWFLHFLRKNPSAFAFSPPVKGGTKRKS